MPRRPSKKSLDSAVKAVQLYIGCAGKTSMRDQQRLYERAMRKAQSIAKSSGMDAGDVWNQLSSEAKRRGPKCPVPGKDI